MGDATAAHGWYRAACPTIVCAGGGVGGQGVLSCRWYRTYLCYQIHVSSVEIHNDVTLTIMVHEFMDRDDPEF